jgi:hypothetical protein
VAAPTRSSQAYGPVKGAKKTSRDVPFFKDPKYYNTSPKYCQFCMKDVLHKDTYCDKNLMGLSIPGRTKPGQGKSKFKGKGRMEALQ